jgi:hypothetical protein
MEREYQDGTKNNVTVFTGVEIEHTPAYGKKTLFVVGVKSADELSDIAIQNNCEHIYLGANHSYKPSDFEEVILWEAMAIDLLKKNFWVTLDIDYKSYEWSEDLMVDLCCYDQFIPVISVKIPYIENLNYNACIKIDDKDFKASNPGVWVHHLHDLKDRKKFTNWSLYGKDKIIDGK